VRECRVRKRQRDDARIEHLIELHRHHAVRKRSVAHVNYRTYTIEKRVGTSGKRCLLQERRRKAEARQRSAIDLAREPLRVVA
jgi:hypothetical protein